MSNRMCYIREVKGQFYCDIITQQQHIAGHYSLPLPWKVLNTWVKTQILDFTFELMLSTTSSLVLNSGCLSQRHAARRCVTHSLYYFGLDRHGSTVQLDWCTEACNHEVLILVWFWFTKERTSLTFFSSVSWWAGSWQQPYSIWGPPLVSVCPVS